MKKERIYHKKQKITKQQRTNKTKDQSDFFVQKIIHKEQDRDNT